MRLFVIVLTCLLTATVGTAVSAQERLNNWAGTYAGIVVGYATADLVGKPLSGNLPDWTHDADGFVGGLTLGHNFQWGNVVAGIEGDFSWADITDSTDLTQRVTADMEMHWFATIRARAGLAYNNALVYMTGGIAMAKLEGIFRDNPPSGSETLVGWTFGAGAEVRLMENLSFKAEGLYYDLGDKDISASNGTSNVSAEGSVWRLGLNYRFY